MEIIPINSNSEAFKKIRTILVDFSPIIRQALRGFIEKQQDIEVIGEAGDGEEAVEISAKLHPDVVIMDINIPILDGLDATRQIVKNNPDTKVLLLSFSTDKETIHSILESGASGCVARRESADVIIHNARKIAAGYMVFPNQVTSTMNDSLLGETKQVRSKSIKLTLPPYRSNKRELRSLK